MSEKAKYWLLTIPQHIFTPFLPKDVVYIKGQLENGANTGYLHWQVVVCFARQVRLTQLKKIFGREVHAIATKTDGANEYVWKEDTRVPNTQFELGSLPLRRNNSKDWERILASAKSGKFDEIPPDVYIRNYRNLKAISVENAQPNAVERRVYVFCGKTGTGKSRTAWEQAGLDAYPKDPCSKFWDGYRGQEKVVIDEFRGQIGISHLLRWLDRYPVLVEVKGSSVVFNAKEIWITSNLHPREWYPDLDDETRRALLRRLSITEYF